MKKIIVATLLMAGFSLQASIGCTMSRVDVDEAYNCLRKDPQGSNRMMANLMRATLENQDTIISNQHSLLANQDAILANQNKILANQDEILARLAK